MQISVTGRNIEVTEPLKSYVVSKLDRVKRHFDHLIDIHVILDIDKLVHRAEANVSTRGKALFADAKDYDMYAAIDALVDKLDRQIIRHKEKLQDHHHTVPHKVMNLN